MLAGPDTLSAALDTDHGHLVGEEWIEHPYRVASPSNTCNKMRRSPPGKFSRLTSCFIADDRLKRPHDERIRMRTDNRAKHVEGRPDIGHPVPDRLTGCILQRRCSGCHGYDRRTEHLHAAHIQFLALAVLL